MLSAGLCIRLKNTHIGLKSELWPATEPLSGGRGPEVLVTLLWSSGVEGEGRILNPESVPPGGRDGGNIAAF